MPIGVVPMGVQAVRTWSRSSSLTIAEARTAMSVRQVFPVGQPVPPRVHVAVQNPELGAKPSRRQISPIRHCELSLQMRRQTRTVGVGWRSRSSSPPAACAR